MYDLMPSSIECHSAPLGDLKVREIINLQCPCLNTVQICGGLLLVYFEGPALRYIVCHIELTYYFKILEQIGNMNEKKDDYKF